MKNIIKELVDKVDQLVAFLVAPLVEKEFEEGLKKEWEESKKAIEEIVNRPEPLFIIWSIEHKGWWCANESGYSKLRGDAGTYTYEDALKIVKGANIGLYDIPNEAMIEYVEKV